MPKRGLFFSIFILVFLAELGDKTQIASFSKAAEGAHPLSVALGACLALLLSTLLAVLFGHKLASLIPKKWFKLIAGILFIGAGIWILLEAAHKYKIF